MELQQKFKCKTCGQPLDELVTLSTNGLVECPSCFNVWTVPKKEASPEALQFLHMGEHDLDVGKFDDALVAYKKASELDPKEPEAYFGMALAEFKIRYLKDHVNNRLQPICYEVTEKKFTDSNGFLRALRYATAEQSAQYEKKGEEIDYILEEFYKLQQSGKRYDCFICVKVTDSDGKGATEDSKDADYIYNLLQDKGYKPFYSERELRNVTGADYEARILYALYTSECMLVVCRNEEYLQTPWVKNEYTRFLKLVNDEEKESDSITIVFNDTPIERLPGRAGKIQGINFARRDADGKVVAFVDAHTPESKRRREAESRKKTEQQEAILKQIEEQKRVTEEQKKAQREIEQRLSNLQTMKVSAPTGATATVKSLLLRAQQELEAGERAQAKDYYVRVLDIEPDCSEAWWGLFLLDMGVKGEQQIIKKINTETPDEIQANRNYHSAVKYAKGEMANRVEEFKNTVFGGEFWWSRFLHDFGYETGVEDFNAETVKNYDILQTVRINDNLKLAKKYASGTLAEKIAALEAQLQDKISQEFLPYEKQLCNEWEKGKSKITSEKSASVAKAKKEIGEKEGKVVILQMQENEINTQRKKWDDKSSFGIADTWMWYLVLFPPVLGLLLLYFILIAPILLIVRHSYEKKAKKCEIQLKELSDKKGGILAEIKTLERKNKHCSEEANHKIRTLDKQIGASNRRIETLNAYLQAGSLIDVK